MRIAFFLLLFLLSVNGWGACSSTSFFFNPYYTGCRANPSGVFPCVSSIAVSGLPSPCCSSGYVEVTPQSCVANKVVKNCVATQSSCTGVTVVCDVCDDEPDLCVSYRAQCEQANGVFSGSTNNGCCIATCNQCGALKDLVGQKQQICCKRGLAPPDQARQCRVEARNTCGMNWSTFVSNDNEFSCQSPSVSAEASQRYADQCFDNSSSSTSNSSSSGGGGSSGGDCPECPILEEILSTLTDQKGTVEEIYRCLSVPDLCNLGGDSLPPWVREKMDVMIDQDSITANNTASIDSAVRAIGDNQKRSDSLTRDVIRGGVDSIVAAITSNGDTTLRKAVEGGFSTLDSTTDALNDSTRKWLRFIADSLGVGTDSIVAHIDSIVSRLTDSILDSILKYQKYATDNFDSAFWGAGNGFQKIDNLTDSAIKYFNQGFHYDSVYSALYRDSLGEIHEAINSLSTSIGYALGYGDTATSTLRGDIEALSGKFDAAAIDTGAVGYGSGFVVEGERFGDSLARAVGWLGGLDGVNHDSIFSAAGFDSIAVDSVGRAVDDSLNLIADSLNNILVAQNDSIKNNLPSTLDAYSDSLIAYSPFASFDSLIFGQLGAKIPNSNQCPDDCNKWSISLPRFGLFNFTIDYGLCLGRVPLGGMNVLGFIRLLLRIVVVWSCIWIVFNALTRRKD